MEKKSWFDKILSIDEMKQSSLVLSLFASLGFGIFFTFEKGDIPVNLTGIIQALIYAIGGVSAVGWAANSYLNRSNLESTYTNQNLTTTQTVQQVTPMDNISIGGINGVVDLNTNPNNSGDNTDPSQRPI